MSLSVQSLTVRRGDLTVLRELSLTAERGEAVVLRGPNGTGKSTLLRAIAGLIPIRSGEIRLDDTELGAERDAFQDRITYAGHQDAIKAPLSIRENLAFWAGLFGGDTEAAIAGFDLGPIADRPAQYCSAGQKRRLGLARLLLAPRPLWLLDEPTVSLDAAATARFADHVAAHCDAGGIALIATHITLGLPRERVFEMPNPKSPAQRAATAEEDDPFLAGSL